MFRRRIELEDRPRDRVDIEKAFKLEKEHRYFNISVLWIFYYPKLVRFLYRLPLRHELVTISSLFCGLAAGWMLLERGYGYLVLASLFMHLKDVLDACDGSLARLKGQTNRIARFLDSLCDFLAITWLLTALALREYGVAGPKIFAAAVLAWLSVFLQCSYFNYYLVSYTKLLGKTNVRLDERIVGEDLCIYTAKWKCKLLIFFQRTYGIVYGWQDRLISELDRWSARRVGASKGGTFGISEKRVWYGDKTLLTMNSPLCFGTHIFVFILCALLSHPEYFYYIVIIPGSGYLILNIFYREARLSRTFIVGDDGRVANANRASKRGRDTWFT